MFFVVVTKSIIDVFFLTKQLLINPSVRQADTTGEVEKKDFGQ